MVRVFGLQSADQKLELGKTSQTRKARIFQEIGPAGESGTHTSLQPLKSSLASPSESERAGDLIIRVVSVPEGFRIRAGSGDTIDGCISVPRQDMEQTLQADDERIAGYELQRFLHQPVRLFPVPSHHCRIWSEIKRILVTGALCPPELNLLASQIVVQAPNINLHDARADRFSGLERASSFKHF